MSALFLIADQIRGIGAAARETAAGIEEAKTAAHGAALDLKAVATAAGEATEKVKQTADAVDDLHKKAGISATGISGSGTGASNGVGASSSVTALADAIRGISR